MPLCKANRQSGNANRHLSIKVAAIQLVITSLFLVVAAANAAEPLNTALPKTYSIPAGNLSDALPAYAAQTGVLLGFDPLLTQGKRTQGLKGQYGQEQGFAELLKGSGLEVVTDKEGKYKLQRAPVLKEEGKSLPEQISLKETVVRSQRFYEIGPLPGLGLTKEEIPGNVQSISAQEIKESRSLSLTDLMNRKLQSVNVNDYQGNPFQMDVTYRGFTAGPQIGTPQGLSVFFDGIRVNEPFGDVVNWDMIPMNALSSVDVFPGSNPIFGLNTLGGAFTVKTKDGFNNAGVDADVLTGSFGRKQLQVSGGWNNGTVALFGAGNFFLEDGWRDNSPSKVNQAFGKANYRGEKLDLSLSTLLVQTELVGNGLLPSQMYEQDRNGVYSSPDTTKNKLEQFQLASSFFVNDTFTITGQVYRRDSKRHQTGSDVFTDYDQKAVEVRNPTSGEQYTYLFNSTNKYGLPDYVVLTIDNYDPNTNGYFDQPFVQGGSTDLSLVEKNKELPGGVVNAYRYQFETWRNFGETEVYNRGTNPPQPLGGGEPSADNFFEGGFYVPFTALNGGQPNAGGQPVINDGGENFFFTKVKDSNGNDVIQKNFIILLPAINESATQGTRAGQGPQVQYPYAIVDANGFYNPLDGIQNGKPGVVKGTPTAVITENNINQIVDGASIQFNWNIPHHKLMVGLSIDAAKATYTNTAQLGFLDANRKAYLDPDQANPILTGADIAIPNNDFSGTNTTKSMYFSETWTPVETLHFSASGRYNETQAKNKIAARYGIANYGVGDVFNYPDAINVCPGGDCTGVPVNFRQPRLNNPLNPAETEKFSYYSFNPSLGMTWQAKENLNLYANWAKGARTPSVVELGCALDKTPVDAGYLIPGPNGTPIKAQLPKSVVENRQCTLPTTLSGDPYLEQIKATTYDVGMRGTIGENMKWNLGAYQTDLKDDIYFIAVGNSAGFFDNIGSTRRRGIEAGLSGKKDKLGFSLNYSLTDATFQDSFTMLNNDNSSSFVYDANYGLNAIRVKPGDTMPGVPLHNLNATVSIDVTPKWRVTLSSVLHSESYLRGNENNEHQTGVTQYRTVFLQGSGSTLVARQPSSNPGKVSGYATFNFQTSYRLNDEWTATMLVNNLFDREYFTAGRLGRNPFSPSILGAIGPDGYNHNSGDWQSSNFISPSAPRGIWFSLNYQFDAKK